MNFKVFIGVFVGLLAVNVSVQSPSLRDDDIKSVIVEVLDKVLNISSVILEEANSIVDTVEKNEDEIVNSIVALAVDIGKDVNSLILEAIDELRANATDDGKAVLDCIEAEKDKTETALSQVFGDIGKCATPEIPKVIAEIRTILKQLSDLQVDVQGQTDTLEKCALGDLLCIVSFVTSLGETAQKIPPVVQSDIEEIKTLIETIISDVKVCGGNVLTEITSSAQEIFNEAVVCIKK